MIYSLKRLSIIFLLFEFLYKFSELVCVFSYGRKVFVLFLELKLYVVLFRLTLVAYYLDV